MSLIACERAISTTESPIFRATHSELWAALDYSLHGMRDQRQKPAQCRTTITWYRDHDIETAISAYTSDCSINFLSSLADQNGIPTPRIMRLSTIFLDATDNECKHTPDNIYRFSVTSGHTVKMTLKPYTTLHSQSRGQTQKRRRYWCD